MPKLTLKELNFDWAPGTSTNPSQMVLKTEDYSAYVLIPYDPGYDPAAGKGSWNGMANHKGQSGFPDRESAMRYCEETIRKDAEKILRQAERWVA